MLWCPINRNSADWTSKQTLLSYRRIRQISSNVSCYYILQLYVFISWHILHGSICAIHVVLFYCFIHCINWLEKYYLQNHCNKHQLFSMESREVKWNRDASEWVFDINIIITRRLKHGNLLRCMTRVISFVTICQELSKPHCSLAIYIRECIPTIKSKLTCHISLGICVVSYAI